MCIRHQLFIILRQRPPRKFLFVLFSGLYFCPWNSKKDKLCFCKQSYNPLPPVNSFLEILLQSGPHPSGMNATQFYEWTVCLDDNTVCEFMNERYSHTSAHKYRTCSGRTHAVWWRRAVWHLFFLSSSALKLEATCTAETPINISDDHIQSIHDNAGALYAN